MTETDLFEFNIVFADVRRVFPLRADETETRQLMSSYFGAFRRFPLPRVRAGAEACIATGTRFPKPAEWIKAMPAPRVVATIAALETDEGDQWLDAERRCWEGRLCACAACQAAGVTARPLRFVPDFDEEDRDLKGRIGDRVVTRGHWAHGDELARWYAAKEKFWGAFHAVVASKAMGSKTKKMRFEDRIAAIFAPKPPPDPPSDREPGEDG